MSGAIAKSVYRTCLAGPMISTILAAISCPLSAGGPIDADKIIRAFVASSDGFSSDELLIRDDLRANFLQSLAEAEGTTIDAATERAALLRLLQLRKSGKLPLRATRRGKGVGDSAAAVAEIAARVVTDRHRITSDTMLADPRFRHELQREAELISPGIDAYAVRKSVLMLRKQRRLAPELVLKVADWGRSLRTMSLTQLQTALSQQSIPKQPGVYLFRSPDGYLYIGEASNLAARLEEHVLGSDRKSLATYLASDRADQVTIELHIFPSTSPASKTTVRRAYESELIRSRQPKFNVRP